MVSHITRVIQEMARLEATVTSAEEAQARAESELLEYAAERRKTEEALVAMQQQLENVRITHHPRSQDTFNSPRQQPCKYVAW